MRSALSHSLLQQMVQATNTRQQSWACPTPGLANMGFTCHFNSTELHKCRCRDGSVILPLSSVYHRQEPHKMKLQENEDILPTSLCPSSILLSDAGFILGRVSPCLLFCQPFHLGKYRMRDAFGNTLTDQLCLPPMISQRPHPLFWPLAKEHLSEGKGDKNDAHAWAH